jgi:hypothetical protein
VSNGRAILAESSGFVSPVFRIIVIKSVRYMEFRQSCPPGEQMGMHQSFGLIGVSGQNGIE